MITRREVLVVMAAGTLAGRDLRDRLSEPRRGIEFVEEEHGLARESAQGFRFLIETGGAVPCPAGCLIAPGVRAMNAAVGRELMERVRSGARLILESGAGFSTPELVHEQLRVLNYGLGVKVRPPIAARGYVDYDWPVRRMVRTFEFVTPVECAAGEVIARWQGLPVGFRRRVGSGSIVYLGSMLGPGLFSEEREAHEVGVGLMA